MPRGFFITGTDTEVGKTFVTASLAAYFRHQGKDVGVFKPMMSGVQREDPLSDAYILKEFAQDHHSLIEINPFQFDEPLAPYIAAKRQGEQISLTQLGEAWDQIKNKHHILLIEGAGGLLVPMGKGYLTVDVARLIGFPLIIVARPGLGTVNHTLLTIEAAQARGLKIAGVILNGLKERNAGVAEQTNPSIIEEFSGVPVWGTLPWIQDLNRKEMIEMIDTHLSLDYEM